MNLKLSRAPSKSSCLHMLIGRDPRRSLLFLHHSFGQRDATLIDEILEIGTSKIRRAWRSQTFPGLTDCQTSFRLRPGQQNSRPWCRPGTNKNCNPMRRHAMTSIFSDSTLKSIWNLSEHARHFHAGIVNYISFWYFR